VDENDLGKKAKYVTLVVDLDSGRVLWVGEGRGKEALEGFWERLRRSGTKIEAVACDMSGAYWSAINQLTGKSSSKARATCCSTAKKICRQTSVRSWKRPWLTTSLSPRPITSKRSFASSGARQTRTRRRISARLGDRSQPLPVPKVRWKDVNRVAPRRDSVHIRRSSQVLAAGCTLSETMRHLEPLGIPLPPVPSNVPALTPDTQGAKTPRDLLAAHTKAADCRGCHQQIDPIGFVLENFDPVGGWREQWPDIHVDIDPSGVLPDATEILGYTDLKRWIVENIDIFGQCLSEELMIYATGRIPSYAEKQELKQIVAKVEKNKGGFRDLLLALMESKTFRTR